MPILRHGADATIGSRQRLREQAKRRVVWGNQEPSIAARLGRSIDEGIAVPRRVTDLARTTGKDRGNVACVGNLRGIRVAHWIRSRCICTNRRWRIHARRGIAGRQDNHNLARVWILAL